MEAYTIGPPWGLVEAYRIVRSSSLVEAHNIGHTWSPLEAYGIGHTWSLLEAYSTDHAWSLVEACRIGQPRSLWEAYRISQTLSRGGPQRGQGEEGREGVGIWGLGCDLICRFILGSLRIHLGDFCTFLIVVMFVFFFNLIFVF